MIFNRFSVQISLQIVLLTILITLGFWSISQDYLSFTKFGFFGLALLQLNYIIYTVNKQNREIVNFLQNFVINETFPRSKKTYQEKSFVEIENQLNRIAESYGKVKFKNEEQHQLLQLLIDHLEIAIIAFETDGRIILINKNACSLFRRDIKNLSDLDMLKSGLSETLEKLKPGNPEVVRLKSGDFFKPFSTKTTQFVLNSKKISLVSFNEIEKELAKEELNGLHTLIKILRHEIINSITPITTLAETMSNKFDSIDPTQTDNSELITLSNKSFNAINKRSSGLLKFIERIKSISSIPEPMMENISINEITNNIIVLFEKEIAKNNTKVLVNIEPLELSIIADEKLITQAIINVFKNALQAVENTNNSIIEFAAKVELSGSVVITISDNGEGIHEENVNNVFVPFFTTRKNGSGIGLSFTRQVMQKHNGYITLDSNNGNTIFKLIF